MRWSRPVLALGFALALPALAAAAGGTARIRQAAIRFEPLAGFVTRQAEAPLLYDSLLTAEPALEARCVLFVVPAAPTVTAEEAFIAAGRVSAFYDDVIQPGSAQVRQEGDLLVATDEHAGQTAALVLAPHDGRWLALHLFGTRQLVDPRVEELLAAGHSLERCDQEMAFGTPVPFRDAHHGLAMELPEGFEVDRLDAQGWLLAAHLPYHFGLDVTLTVDLETDHLAKSIDDHARLLADHWAGGRESAIPLAIEPVERRADASPARRMQFEFGEPPVRTTIHLIQLERHRIRIELSTPAEYHDLFRPALEASAHSVVRIDRQMTLGLERRYHDSSAGFAIRPPIGFIRSRVSDDLLVRFKESTIRPPAAMQEVRHVDLPDGRTEMDRVGAAARKRISAAEQSGLRLVESLRMKLINGLTAASFETRSNDPDELARTTWLILTTDHLFDVTFTVRSADAGLYEDLFRSSMLSFEPIRWSAEPALDQAVTHEEERLSFRPPLGWTASEPAPALLAFQEPDQPAGGRVEVGVDPAPETNPFSGAADAYRRAVLAALEARGYQHVRVEKAERIGTFGRPEFRFQLAYTDGTRSLREARRAIQSDDRIAYVRVVLPGKRFRAYRLLVDATLGSLELGEP